MLQAVYTFAIFGAFILGGVISWIAKEYVDAYIDNAHYEVHNPPRDVERRWNSEPRRVDLLAFH